MLSQIDLFESMNLPGAPMPSAMARRSDPETSKAAARAAVDLATQHQAAIVRCLKQFGALGKDGIASRTRITGVQVARRLPELERIGLVKLTGKRVPSTSGRSEREWGAVA